MTLDAFAGKLGISRKHLCDIEKGGRKVNLDRASKWARTLGCSETLMVQFALQQLIEEAGFKMEVRVNAA